MADSQFYIRVRGRVMGPFDEEKVQGLTRRGQLSKMHEVSTDGVTWEKAASFPELFVVNVLNVAASNDTGRTSREDAQTEVAPRSQAASTGPPYAAQGWYYTSFGQELGPVDFSKLQMLVATGQVGAQDQVWTNGMPTWTAVPQIPGLSSAPAAQPGEDPSSRQSAGGSSEKLSVTLSNAAQASRLWILFIGITGFVIAALLVVGGVSMLVAGGRMGPAGAASVFSGIVSIIQAVIITAAASLLSMYASQLSTLSHKRTQAGLERALIILKQFWTFVGIVLIVWLAFIGVLVTLVFSSVISLPA